MRWRPWLQDVGVGPGEHYPCLVNNSNACPICGALVAEKQEDLHFQWHKANKLHGPHCYMLTVANPISCNCGVGT